MEAIGFEYYMQLLDQAVRGLKGEAVEEENPEINLKADIRVPEDYLRRSTSGSTFTSAWLPSRTSANRPRPR